MSFRYDINALRALAVLAVVLFHFNPDWMPGGFAGVDVFFVISGFLMTSIIFRGLQDNTFSLLKFYVARANRIIPSLAVLCLALLVFGYYLLGPWDYRELGKHVASSMGFLSNIIYLKESGYFDASSHEKWLLHTWSLSVEWQFYVIYPVILLLLSKLFSIQNLKRILVIGTIISFAFSVYATFKWPSAAYYLLPTRAWEMMFGGLAFIYPWKLKANIKQGLFLFGFLLIITSYFFVSNETPWPGYFALLPVMGSYLIIVSGQKNNLIIESKLLQLIGKWSYSIYLWHWPLVVFGFYFDIQNWYLYGLILSFLLGYINYKFIESFKWSQLNSWFGIWKVKPIWMVLILGGLSSSIFINNGYMNRFNEDLVAFFGSAKPSPYRSKCHIETYKDPSSACEYFSPNVSWATFGDSHTVEVAYALALRLKKQNIGMKHFSFSGCLPSFKQDNEFSACSKWYNDAVEEIITDRRIKNVVFNHRFSSALFGDHAKYYPEVPPQVITPKVNAMLFSIDEVIKALAKEKDNIYVYYPIPEISRNVTTLAFKEFVNGRDLNELTGTTYEYYKERNSVIINHFENSNYPPNVHFIQPHKDFCKEDKCLAVMEGQALYFDDDHPSVYGATRLVQLLPIQN